MAMSEYQTKRIEAENRKAAALELIGEGLRTIGTAIADEEGSVIQAILQHASVNKNNVARAIENVAASIVNSDFGRGAEENED